MSCRDRYPGLKVNLLEGRFADPERDTRRRTDVPESRPDSCSKQASHLIRKLSTHYCRLRYLQPTNPPRKSKAKSHVETNQCVHSPSRRILRARHAHALGDAMSVTLCIGSARLAGLLAGCKRKIEVRFGSPNSARHWMWSSRIEYPPPSSSACGAMFSRSS